MRPKTTTEYLRHDFSEAEITQMGKDLAQAFGRQTAIDQEFNAVKAAFKDRMAHVEQEIGTLSRNITQRFEMRNVECRFVWNSPKPGFVETVRADTEEAVKVRAMTSGEAQEELPLETGQASAAEAGAE